MKNRVVALSFLAFSLILAGCSSVLEPLASPKGYIKEVGHIRLHRYRHFSTVLPDGKLMLLAGSYESFGKVKIPNNKILNSREKTMGAREFHEIYTPKSDNSQYVSSFDLSSRIPEDQMTILKDGTILLTGRANSFFERAVPLWKTYCKGYCTGVARFYPKENKFKYFAGPWPQISRHAAVALPNGKVLLMGGETQSGLRASVEIGVSSLVYLFDPKIEQFKEVGQLKTARYGHQAILLKNGKVLIVGGDGVRTSSKVLSFPLFSKQSWHEPFTDIELYDPVTNTSRIIGQTYEERREFVSVLLTEGKVLIAGGQNFVKSHRRLDTVEEIDPETGKSNVVSRITAFGYPFVHALVPLPDGKAAVLTIRDLRIYDPATRELKILDTLIQPRKLYSVAFTPDHKLYILGGTVQERVADHTRVEMFDYEEFKRKESK